MSFQNFVMRVVPFSEEGGFKGFAHNLVSVLQLLYEFINKMLYRETVFGLQVILQAVVVERPLLLLINIIKVLFSLRAFMKKHPMIQLFLAGYFSIVAFGWFILQLPFCQKNFVSEIDVLFTTASAVSTTGLSTVDIGTTFSFLGQMVILLLIQLGGIGYMIFSSLLLLSFNKKSVTADSIESTPPFSDSSSIKELTKQILIYTSLCEISALTLLFFSFRNEGVENAFWNALFHSVSAFCTAGFSLFSSNLEGYKNHFGINVIISFFSLMGAFGFFLWTNFFKSVMNRKTLMSLLNRIMQSFAAVAIVIGGLFFSFMTIFLTDNSKLPKLLTSFFQIISTITTTGFNTVDIRTLPLITHFLIIVLMILGVSLTGNGKNLRGTSFTILLQLVANIFRNKNSLWSKKVLLKRTQIVFFSFVCYCLILLLAAPLLYLIEKKPLFPLFFETASALCTIGLSVGITPELSIFGKSLVALLMLTSRISILIIGFAISSKALSWNREKKQKFAGIRE